MTHDSQRNARRRNHPPQPVSHDMLGRLIGLGIREVDAAELVLTNPHRRLARTIDAYEVADMDRDTDAHTWIAAAVLEPERVEAELERHRGWSAWQRLHRSWESADALRAQQERRSQGWAASVSDALDDDQLLRAAERISRPVGVLARRSVPVARAQVLAWAVAVHAENPDVPLRDALIADLEGSTTAPDPLDTGLPEPPADAPRSGNDLTERLTAAIERLPDVEPEPQREVAAPPRRGLERTLERSLRWGCNR